MGRPSQSRHARLPRQYKYPQLLPGGRYLLHHVSHTEGGRRSIAVTEIATGEQKIVFEGGFAPRYVPTGHLLVAQEDLLLGMTFDLETLKVGPPVPVLRGLATDFGGALADYAVSESGSLVYLTGALEKDGWMVRLTPGHEPERLNRQPTNFNYLSCDVSPDGRRVAVDRNDFDIWIFDLESRDFEVRLTTDPALDSTPVWEPTGEGVTFASYQGGRFSIRSRRANGLGEARPLLEDRDVPAGRARGLPTARRCCSSDSIARRMPTSGWSRPAGLPQPGPSSRHPSTSGSGVLAERRLGGVQVVANRGDPRSTSPPTPIAPSRERSRAMAVGGRGGAPTATVCSTAARGRVMVVEALDAQWTPSQPEVFVEGVDTLLTWDVTPDGKSVIALEQRPALRLHLVQNWFEELKRLVPVD